MFSGWADLESLFKLSVPYLLNTPYVLPGTYRRQRPFTDGNDMYSTLYWYILSPS